MAFSHEMISIATYKVHPVPKIFYFVLMSLTNMIRPIIPQNQDMGIKKGMIFIAKYRVKNPTIRNPVHKIVKMR